MFNVYTLTLTYWKLNEKSKRVIRPVLKGTLQIGTNAHNKNFLFFFTLIFTLQRKVAIESGVLSSLQPKLPSLDFLYKI